MIAARCPWYIAGPLIGLLIVALRAATNKPFGALGGYIELVDGARGARRPGFAAWLLIGTAIGSAIYRAVAGPSAAPAVSASVWQLLLFAIAGVVMGVGARMAGGCTSGHGLNGNALGSPASLVSTMTFFGTAVGLSLAFSWLAGAWS